MDMYSNDPSTCSNSGGYEQTEQVKLLENKIFELFKTVEEKENKIQKISSLPSYSDTQKLQKFNSKLQKNKVLIKHYRKMEKDLNKVIKNYRKEIRELWRKGKDSEAETMKLYAEKTQMCKRITKQEDLIIKLQKL